MMTQTGLPSTSAIKVCLSDKTSDLDYVAKHIF